MEQIYFGQRIAQLRRERGMTQENLAQKLGVTNQAVSKWESDQCCPDIMQLPVLADTFGITLDELFGRAQKTNTMLPWPDDGNLRAVCFLGQSLVERKEILPDERSLEKAELHFSGTVENIRSDYSVICKDSIIHGNVWAGDGVQCGEVGGGVRAGDSVDCGSVRGSVTAGDSIQCGDVGGSAHAGDSLHCGNIGGMAKAGDRIYCTGKS